MQIVILYIAEDLPGGSLTHFFPTQFIKAEFHYEWTVVSATRVDDRV